jgi:DHA1 family tetracycline resistance protein-like MFS transporter
MSISTANNPKPGRAAFIFVFVTVCLDMLALGVMVPVLPKLLVQMKGGDIASGAAISGIFGFTWAAMQFFFSPVLGGLSDRFGRRPVILLSNLGLGLDYILMALAGSIPLLFLGRVISGITTSSFPTACAYISDITPSEKRAAKFGMLSAAFGLGFVVGPSVGGLLAGINLRLPFWVAAGLSLINFVYGYFILPESLQPENRSKSLTWTGMHPLGSLKFVKSFPGLVGLTGVLFLFSLAHEALPSVFVLYTDFRYGWSETKVGAVLGLVGISTTIVSAMIVGPVVKKLGERAALITGLCFGITAFIIFGASSSGTYFIVGVPVLALWGFISPSLQSMMSQKVPASEQGQLQGALSSLRGVGGMIGPLLFTQIFAVAIGKGATVQIPGAPYFFAAFLLMLSLLWAWRVTNRIPELQGI